MKLESGSIGKYASIINRFGQIFFDRAFKDTGISCGQQFFLPVIDKNPGINQYELAQASGFDKGTTAKGVKKLAELGFLRRECDAEDKRVVRLFCSEAAKEMLALVDSSKNAWKEILTEGMSPEEKEQAERLMKRMAENAIQYIWKDKTGKEEEV